MVTTVLKCPTCGANDLNVCEYDSMMVLREDLALFSVRCPHCSTMVSSVCVIPHELCEEIQFVAIELGAGMGRE